MRIGLINQLHGRPGPDQPTWTSIRTRASAAEEVGFDSFVFEDSLLLREEAGTAGSWESVSIAAALAAVTERITLGQSVVNNPYRAPALTAKSAETIDEISGGRYVLGIGSGATPDSEYEAFGFPTDRRYSRFAEAIQIIHALLKTGEADFSGEFSTVSHAEMVLREPRPEGPPINIAAGSPKMLGLAAMYGDAWNWWGWDKSHDETVERVQPIVEMLERACRAIDRDPATLVLTYDLYSVIAPGFSPEGSGMSQPIGGTADEIADRILRLGELGIAEVRCDVYPKTTEAIEAMQPVIEVTHAA